MRISLLIVLFFAIIEFAVASDFLPKSFEASIEQQNISQIKIGKKIKKNIIKSDVYMKYKYPSNVYFDVKEQTLYICNSDKTWLYNAPWDPSEKGELTVGSSSKHCYVKVFDALRYGLSTNKVYKVTKKDLMATLIFSDNSRDELSIVKVDLKFKSKITDKTTIGSVKSMDLYYVGKKNPTTFVFKSLNTKKEFNKNDFVFIPPKNTNIKNI